MPKKLTKNVFIFILNSFISRQANAIYDAAFLDKIFLLKLQHPWRDIPDSDKVAASHGEILLFFADRFSINATVSPDFRPLFFCWKDSTWNPYEHVKNGFTNFFVFAKIFDRKVRKSQVRVVNNYADTQICL